MPTDKTPTLLPPAQRAQFVRIPDDLSDREIARFYTFTAPELAVIKRQRRPVNQLGFAVQLAVLKFPGRTLTDLPDIPVRVLDYIAGQVRVPPTALADYGRRENTLYEHLDEIRAHFGFRNYGWRELRAAMRALLLIAMESDRVIPLIEAALDEMRQHQIIAPGMTTIERLVWRVRGARCSASR